MRFLRNCRFLTVVCLSMLGCQDAPVSTEAANTIAASEAVRGPAAKPVQVFTREVQVGANQEIVVTVLPEATCLLQSRKVPDAGSTLELYSDDEGELSFSAMAENDNSSSDVEVDCTDAAGRTATYSIKLESTLREVQQVARNVKGVARPALDVDPNSISDAKLVSLGFPPRPDPIRAQAAHADWLRLVRQPATMVKPRLHPTKRRADVNTDIWAGYSTNDTREYTRIQGGWTVPLVYGERGRTDYSALWVGLNTNDTGLWQAGTEQEVTVVGFFGGISLRSTYAWVELLPAGQTRLSAPTVSPGQTFYTYLWIGDSVGQIQAHGSNAWYYVWNSSTNVVVQGSVPTAGTNTNFVSGVWIVERPKTHPVEPPYNHLANFGTVVMNYAYAGNASDFLPYTYLSQVSLSMFEPATGHTLAQAYPLSGVQDGMQLVWRNFY